MRISEKKAFYRRTTENTGLPPCGAASGLRTRGARGARSGVSEAIGRTGALLALTLLLTLLAPLGPAFAEGPFEEFPVSNPNNSANGNELSPAVGGDVVVWEDDRSATDGLDLWGKKLSSPEQPEQPEFLVAGGPGDQSEPAMSGDTVVWEDNRAGNLDVDVYGKKLSGGAEFLVAGGPGDQQRPAIDGDVVVWEDGPAGNRDIKGVKLPAADASGAVVIRPEDAFSVASGAGDQTDPAIDSGTVVWQDLRNSGNSDIYGKQLSGGSELQLTSDPGWQDQPAVSGGTVVWQDLREAGHSDIYGKDLSGGSEFTIADAPGDQRSPAISSGLVVWTDGRNDDPDIFFKNLSTKSESYIVTGAGRHEHPAISGEIVVWETQGTTDTTTGGFGTYDIRGAHLFAAADFGLSATPDTVRYGDGLVTLSGKLVARGEALGGEKVIIEQRPVGAQDFTSVPGGELTTAADGSFSFPGAYLTSSTDFRARFAGDPARSLRASTSPSTRVNYQTTVSLNLSKTSTERGKPIKIFGSVLPQHAGSVKVTIKRNGVTVAGWSERDVPLDNYSMYRTTYVPKRTGTYNVIVSFAGDADHLGSTSPAKTFKVKR